MPDRDDQAEQDDAQPQQPAEFQQHHVVEALNEFQEAQQHDMPAEAAEPDPAALQAPPEIPAAPEVGPIELPPEPQPSPVDDVVALKEHGLDLAKRGESLAEMLLPPAREEQADDEPEPATPAAAEKPPQEQPQQPPNWIDAVAEMARAMQRERRAAPPESEDGQQRPNFGGIPVEGADERFPEFGGKDAKAEHEAALRDALRGATGAEIRLLDAMVERLRDHERRLNALYDRLEQER